jgi:CP family cyanate transporter-like MFS transporter
MITTCFGLLGITFYGLNSWLADAYVERGWSDDAAGGLIGVYNIAALPGGLLITWLADRLGSRRAWFSAFVLLMAVGMLGIVLLPGGAWLWVVLMGFANGVLFALVMTLPLDVSDDPAQVGAVAGMMLGVGYCFAAISPFLLGGVLDLTGSTTTALWVVVGFISLLFVASRFLTHERLHRGVEPAEPALSGRES